MSAKPIRASSPEMANRAGIMPEAAVEPIGQCRNRDFPAVSRKGCHHGNDLVVPDTRFQNKLVVSDASVRPLCIYNAVEDIFSVIALIQRQIVLFQL